MIDAFWLELWLDRCEASLAPELAAHDRAVLARALLDRDPPPPPPGLLDPAVLATAARAGAVDDPTLRRRLATLTRWSLAARVAMAPATRDAHAAPRDLIGLAARHRALGLAARELGQHDAPTLVAALYGAAPVPTAVPPPEPAGASVDAERDRLPTTAGLLAWLAARTAIDPAPIALHVGPRALTVVVAAGREVHCLVGPGDDDLARLMIATHELGHGLLGAAAPRALTLGAPTSRVADEAAAAWAVRALEQWPALPAAELARRRRRRERLTAALAGFEAACLSGADPAVAWALVAAVDPRPPATFAALFDEPGVMAAYHAADQRAATDLARPRA